jgi:DNA polymerase (family 10)/histidinol-phosphatase (PHP family)
MLLKKHNIHLHTKHSDGRFAMNEVIDFAETAELEAVGISDHFFTQKVFRDMDMETYMNMKWPLYLEDIELERKKVDRKIHRWFGIEIDTCVDRLGCAIADLPWSDINSTMDYVLFEYIGEHESGGMSIREIGKLRSWCKIPMIVAHPHLERIQSYLPFDFFCTMMSLNGIAMEICAGPRNKWFWTQKEVPALKNVHLLLGSDMHDDLNEIPMSLRALSFLEKTGLQDRLVDPDKLKRILGVGK